jgi:peptide-methionine (R)-S-oxide reductase
MYVCAACGHELFSSMAKFDLPEYDPNSGWPSFDSPTNPENVELKPDDSNGMHRVEIVCKNCGSHLGHLFDDGPKETTGQHYCVNSCALEFKKTDK